MVFAMDGVDRGGWYLIAGGSWVDGGVVQGGQARGLGLRTSKMPERHAKRYNGDVE